MSISALNYSGHSRTWPLFPASRGAVTGKRVRNAQRLALLRRQQNELFGKYAAQLFRLKRWESG